MSLLPVRNKHGKIGYIDRNGDVRIKPQFREGYSFSYGIAKVKKDNGYFYINEENTPITEEFVYATDFSANGLALVRKEKEFYYINVQGEKVISVPTHFDGNPFVTAKPFMGEYAILTYNNYKYILLNEKGEMHPFHLANMENFYGFSDGVARVRINIPTKTGKPLFRTIYFDSKLNFIQGEFKNNFETGYKFGLDYKNGLAGVSYPSRFNTLNDKGFIDKNGNFIIKARYSDVNSFVEEGFAVVKEKSDSYYYSSWKFIDKSDETLRRLPKAITEVGEFSEGLAPVKRMGFWGFMNKKGEIVIPAESRKVESFNNGFAKIIHKYGISYINTEGERVFGDPLPY